MKNIICDLMKLHTGKVVDKWSLYLREYDRLFEKFRKKRISFLEIGIQNGGSLELWSKYFNNARLIVGCDIDECCQVLTYTDSRVRLVIGDVSTAKTQRQILNLSPHYDVIIDDGSHKSSDIINSFALYFSALSEGGLYIVEDLHCSYWHDYQGGLHHPLSSIHFFKSLCDIVNHQSWGLALSRQHLLKEFSECYATDFSENLLSQIHSVEFINSMCIIRKACPSNNSLGCRLVVGTIATVNANPLLLDGQELISPQQNNAGGLSIQELFRENKKLEHLNSLLGRQLNQRSAVGERSVTAKVSDAFLKSQNVQNNLYIYDNEFETNLQEARLTATNLFRIANLSQMPNDAINQFQLTESSQALRETLKSLQ